MRNLEPAEMAKVARLWVPVAGHLYVVPGEEGWYRVLRVEEGQTTEMVDKDGWTCDAADMPDFGRLMPCFWGDDATTDGLARTARAAWRDESLHVVPVGVDFTVTPKHVLRFRLCRSAWWLGVVEQQWGKTGWITPEVECPQPVDFDSEADALIAAILAAPEAK